MKIKRMVFIIATLSFVLFVIMSVLLFGRNLSLRKGENIAQALRNGVEPNTISFELQMAEQVNKVKTLAKFLGDNWDITDEMKRSLLRSAVENNGLLRCSLAERDGSFITYDEQDDGNLSSGEFFQANMRGEFIITDPRTSTLDASSTIIVFSAPVFDSNEQVIGSLIYSYLCNDLDKIFNLQSMDGEMCFVVTKSTGELLIGRSPYAERKGNLVDNLVASCTHDNHAPSDCLSLNDDSAACVITPRDTSEPLYVLHERLSYNDWYMVATITERAANANISFAVENQRNLSSAVFASAVVYFGVLLLLWLSQGKMIDRATGAPTLAAFRKNSRRILKARLSEQYVIVMLDIKDFKLINRIYSFATGDKVIKSVAQALREVLVGNDCTMARVGVDSFILLLPYKNREDLDSKRQAFIRNFHTIMDESFCTKIVFPTGQYLLKPSDFPRPDMADIFEKANFAHRAAKQNSDVIIDYEEDIETAAIFIKTVEDRMEDAIKAKEFALYLQPKVRLSDETMCGAEALVRWHVGDRCYMYPADFIPVLEKNGFIVQLDFYMFRCAAVFLRECMDKGIKPVPISVNFSRHHLGNGHLIRRLADIADEYSVPHDYLEIEVTESAFLGRIEDMVELIGAAHAAGFNFAMDDFGSGYSCFAQLKDLKIDVIKIDKEFFGESKDEGRARIVVKGIISIAKQLQIATVAEGIEDAYQVEMLKEFGCDIVQGYYYAKPMPASLLNVEDYTQSAIQQ